MNDATTVMATVIRVDALRRWALYAVGILLISLPFLIVGDSKDAGGAAIALLLVMAPALGVLFFVARRTRLVLDKPALSYFNLGVSARVPWADVDTLLVKPTLCGLILKKPLDLPGMRRLRRFSGMAIAGNAFYTEQQQQLINEMRFIDLRAYRHKLRDPETQRLLRAYKADLKIDSHPTP